MTDDWYRKAALSPEEKAGFESRLKRSRSSRPEYMRIQAGALRDAGAPRDALTLLGRILAEHPEHLTAWIHELSGDCYRDLDDTDASLAAYRAALNGGRTVQGHAHFKFADLVLGLGRGDLYAEALDHLNTYRDRNPIFPKTAFDQDGYAARLMERLGAPGPARDAAERALAAAAKTQSNARHHRDLGLVTGSQQDRAMTAELQRITGSRAGRGWLSRLLRARRG